MKFKNTALAAALLLQILDPKTAAAQSIFKKITNSPVTTTAGDSRSVNWIDIENDGDLDLFISNGKQGGEHNFLYKNDGKGNFTTVSGSPIVEDGKPSDGATWADFDNDGDADCYVVNWYGENNLLYQNEGLQNGEVVFSLVQTGIVPFDGGYSETASWGDFDSDGWLDLYVSNSDGSRRNFLYRNLKNGDFEKITTGAAVTDAFFSRSVNWTDFDSDGDLDLFVTNENNQNENLYRNDAGVLTKVTASSNPLINSAGKTMSSSWGDYDNDGRLDVFLANDGGNDLLFHNDGGDVFSKITNSPVVSSGGNSFGSQFADVNNDGWLDLFVTNAFWGGAWQNFLFLNRGDGTFERNTTEVVATDAGWSYGCAFGDMDRDGDLDLATANCFDANQNDGLYENMSATNGNSWLEVELVGTKSNRSAIGAKVILTAKIGGKTITQLREISAQSGHCGQNQLAAHFGLGKLDEGKIESLRVQWPSGGEEVFGNIFPNQFVKIVEGQGITSTENALAVAAGLQVFAPSPNPFSHSVACRFELAAATDLQIEVIDNQGVFVKKLAVGNFPAGDNQVVWSADGVAGGVYFLRFLVGGLELVRTLVKI